MSFPLNLSADELTAADLARFHMIEQQIRPWNVSDSRVLGLLAEVRRELFVPAGCEAMAFTDMELPLTADSEACARLGQVMLAPRVEARLLQDLQLQGDERVLEIGTGSGHMAALLAASSDQVVSLEIDAALAQRARENLRAAGIVNVQVRQADGALDPIPDGPFDAIVLSGSVAEVPERLLALLRNGGRLAAIVGQQPMMRATFVRRRGDAFSTTQPWDLVVPRLQNFPEPSAFRF